MHRFCPPCKCSSSKYFLKFIESKCGNFDVKLKGAFERAILKFSALIFSQNSEGI
eukprot:UN13007